MCAGSSDLWVAGSVSQTSSLGKTETLSYAIGKASGQVQSAVLEFGGYTVDNQAYRMRPISSVLFYFLTVVI